MLIDTHSHLNHEDYEADLPETIMRARNAGVGRMLVAAYDAASSEKGVEIAGAFDGIVASAGVHPHDAKTVGPDEIERLRELAKDDKVVAIGEIGLDFHYDLSPRDKQEEAFRLQIRLAHELGLPVIVHNRESGREVMAVLKSEPAVGGVMHCFSEGPAFAAQVLDLGFYIGIAGPVTYKRSDELREVVKTVPLDRLLIETDCPYLAPQQHRGKRNEPAYVVYVAEKVAEVRGISLEAVAEATTGNAFRLFGEW